MIYKEEIKVQKSEERLCVITQCKKIKNKLKKLHANDRDSPNFSKFIY